MSQCKNIIHPFQNDPGVSQRQRLIPELDVNAPKIDGRTLADLLDYFTRLSRHINYYDANLATSDWQPFFNKSIPFNLSSISKYDAAAVEEKFDFYRSLFYKRPGKRTLQLVIHYMYYSTVYRINTWHKSVDNSQLVFEQMLENLVIDRLMDPVKSFIALTNSAAREHCIKSINFTPLAENTIWNLQSSDLKAMDTSLRSRRGSRNRLMGMMEALSSLWPAMIEAVKLLSGAAEHSIEESLFSTSEELKQEHTPHLALLFAFLKLFQHLQSDLNGFTKKHLDFFFKEVLRLQPRAAEADKAHIVFEIQKQLDSHLLKKGVQVKDAKDKNNAEILFALDDEIVVNKAQVEEVRTLFLNTELAHDNSDLSPEAHSVVELLTNEEPERFEELYEALPPETHVRMENLSPLAGGEQIAAPVELASGPRDKYFPISESFALGRIAPEHRVTVSEAIDPSEVSFSLRDIPAFIRLDGFVVRSLREARREPS